MNSDSRFPCDSMISLSSPLDSIISSHLTTFTREEDSYLPSVICFFCFSLRSLSSLSSFCFWCFFLENSASSEIKSPPSLSKLILKSARAIISLYRRATWSLWSSRTSFLYWTFYKFESDHWLGSKYLSGEPLTLRMFDIGRENLVLEPGRKDIVLDTGRIDLVLELGRENLILELGRSPLGGLLNIPFNSRRSIFFS